MGAHVIVANGDPSQRDVSHAKLFQPTPATQMLPQTRPTPIAAVAAPVHLEGHQTDVVRLASLSPRGAATDAVAGLKPVKPPVDAATAARMLGILEGKVARAAAYMRRSKSPIRILITRRTGRERVRDAQRLLARLGYDVGVPDGVVGRQTVKAIKAFQTANERTPGGHPNALFYADLYRLSGLKKPSEGHLYVRQDFVNVFDAPIVLKDAEIPLGTHFFMLMDFKPGETAVRWRAMTLKSRGRIPRSSRKRRKSVKSIERAPAMTALQALDRFEIPTHVRTRISDILTPGSSVVITDKGISHETGRGTDFVVLTR
jgi:peptidoglycan hydrolase-like protein with peptidoglycan-binding domain